MNIKKTRFFVAQNESWGVLSLEINIEDTGILRFQNNKPPTMYRAMGDSFAKDIAYIKNRYDEWELLYEY